MQTYRSAYPDKLHCSKKKKKLKQEKKHVRCYRNSLPRRAIDVIIMITIIISLFINGIIQAVRILVIDRGKGRISGINSVDPVSIGTLAIHAAFSTVVRNVDCHLSIDRYNGT